MDKPGRHLALLGRCLRHPVFVAFVVSASLIQASHAVYYGFGTIHWQSLGIGDDVIGFLWATGVIAEVALFLYSKRLMGLSGPVLLIVAGGAGAALRWTLTALEPGIGWLFLVQGVHALTFGATHLGTMHLIARMAPRNIHASVQGIYAAFASGIVMALALFASGLLYAEYAAAAYFAMALLGAAGAVLAWFVWLKWNGGRLFEAEEI